MVVVQEVVAKNQYLVRKPSAYEALKLSVRAELRIDLLEHSTRTAWSRLSTTNNFYFAALEYILTFPDIH